MVNRTRGGWLFVLLAVVGLAVAVPLVGADDNSTHGTEMALGPTPADGETAHWSIPMDGRLMDRLAHVATGDHAGHEHADGHADEEHLGEEHTDHGHAGKEHADDHTGEEHTDHGHVGEEHTDDHAGHGDEC